MEEIPVPPASPAETPRPRILSFLCILTFVWSGINAAASLAIGIFPHWFRTAVLQLAQQYDMPGIDQLASVSPVFFYVSTLLYGGCLVGAWMMWHLRRTGFHVYTVSQILLLLTPMYFFRLPVPTLADALSTGFFILLYRNFLKKMT
jgi:hypothetical protein